MLSIVQQVEICWFYFLGVTRGLWQSKVYDNKLRSCLGIFKGIIWDFMVHEEFYNEFMEFCGLC
jgi:hypothetical protein